MVLFSYFLKVLFATTWDEMDSLKHSHQDSRKETLNTVIKKSTRIHPIKKYNIETMLLILRLTQNKNIYSSPHLTKHIVGRTFIFSHQSFQCSPGHDGV